MGPPPDVICANLANLCCLAAALRLDPAFDGFLATNVDLDLLRFGLSALRQIDLQNTIYVLGMDVLLVNRIREGERASEAAVTPFNAMKVLFFLFLLELTLA